MSQNKNLTSAPAAVWPLWLQIKHSRLEIDHILYLSTLLRSSVLIKINWLSSHLSLILSRGSDNRKRSIFILGYKYTCEPKRLERFFILWSFICPELQITFDLRCHQWLTSAQCEGFFFLFFFFVDFSLCSMHLEHSPENPPTACAECGSVRKTMLVNGLCVEAEVEETDMGLKRRILTCTNLTTP